MYGDDTNTLTLYFRVQLGTDPRGDLTALDRADFDLSPQLFTSLNDCVVTYDPSNVYTVVSSIDLSTPIGNPPAGSNLCGVVGYFLFPQMICKNVILETKSPGIVATKHSLIQS